MTPFPLASTFVVLDGALAATPVPVTPALYGELDARFGGFAGCLLVAEYAFTADWPTWERHPAGDELLVLLAGAAELRLWRDGREEAVPFATPGTALVIPRDTWHTAKVAGSCRILFITPGEGTENRSEPALGPALGPAPGPGPA